MDGFQQIKLKLNQIRKSQPIKLAENPPAKSVAVPTDHDASQSTDSNTQPENSTAELQAEQSPSPPKPALAEVEQQQTPKTSTASCKLRPRLERPKMPTFNGDVRDYHTFKDDFKHMIDPMYSPRDAVSILWISLTGRIEQQSSEQANPEGLLKFLENETKTRRRVSASITSLNTTPQ